MTDLENLKISFCKAVKNAKNINDIKKIVIEELPEGITKAIPDFILAYCEINSIAKRGDPALAFIEQEAQETRERETKEQREKAAADIAGKIAHYQKNLAAGVPVENADLMALAGDIEKQAAALGKNPAIVDRVGSWDSYITECITYEPEKDFMPELFHGLAFPPGTVSYIGARAKVGKTTAMINLCREALFSNRNVFFITLEMSRKQLLTKLLLCTAYNMAAAENATTGLDTVEKPTKTFYNIVKGRAGQEVKFQAYIQKAIEIIKPWYKTNFVIYDGRGASFQEIMNAIKTNTKPGTLVLVDYVQRLPSVDGDKSDNFTRVKYISDGLVNIATKTESIIISGAQFNRETAKKRAADGAEVVELTDFRESGDIEQDGHNLIGIGRLAGQGTRYIKMLAARESMVEDNAYSLRFAGGYSYMAIEKEMKAPETSDGYSRGNGLGQGYSKLSDEEKEAARKAVDEFRKNTKPEEPEKKNSTGRIFWNPGGRK